MSILEFGPFRAAWREVFLSPGLDKLDPGLLEFGPLRAREAFLPPGLDKLDLCPGLRYVSARGYSNLAFSRPDWH